jgi:hydroxymethylbilane synthase
MGLEMIDGNKGFVRSQRERFRCGQAHHDSTDQPRSGCCCNRVHIRKLQARLVEGAFDQPIQQLDMGARGDFRHDAAIGLMFRDLGIRNVRENFTRAGGKSAHHRRRGFVATRFECQHSQGFSQHQTDLCYGQGHVHFTFSNPMTAVVRLATRGSPLALAQTTLVRQALAEAHGWDPDELDEICPIRIFRTTGDRIQDRPLVEAGGKGLFVKEIEDALLEGDADIAVHSMKDMPAEQPAGLVIAAVLPREEPYDIFFARDGAPFDKLPENARLGTSSVRRQAQALRLRPDLKIVPLRGNVETRLLKLGRGEADAIMLARAGLIRLNLSLPDSEILAGEEWLPALCQGIVGIETRAGISGGARWFLSHATRRAGFG